ncbi:hypothetical protein [Kribbella catacumbae]|uniref:hypothetical protein n=1 Tax=Kribbella catacumbae TaxID=460086 RepID=UPI0012FBB51E|nr:hypothetical protein [Kribbella catacumbae]
MPDGEALGRSAFYCYGVSSSQATTAAELVIAVPQPDDSGASTADRYEWQAAMAAADGLALYLRWIDVGGDADAAEQARILCEVHEDWVVMIDSDAELVSAKHRDPAYGAYTTMVMLLKDGGLAHLFDRWKALGRNATCRLVTTSGLGSTDTQSIEKAIAWLKERRTAGQPLTGGPDEPAVAKLAEALSAAIKSAASKNTGKAAEKADQGDVLADVYQFLSMLTISHGHPQRTHLPYAAPAMYAKAVTERLGIATPPEAVWEAVVGIFRLRMRAAGPTRSHGLPTVLPQIDSLSMEPPFRARIVSVGDIDLAIRSAVRTPGGYLPLPRAVRTTKVAVKMDAGKCFDNSIERAEELRLAFQRYWRDRLSGDPTAGVERERLRRWLLRIADEATSAVANDLDPWGRQLWSEVQARLEAAPDFPELDRELLLGGICFLVGDCKIWFSARFDVVAEQVRLKSVQAS